jgi:putative glutamine amidotransferase
MKPVIGITPDFEQGKEGESDRYFVNEAYLSAVEQAEGIPLILPYADAPEEVALLLDRIHGLIVTGGAFDIDPSYYGETWTVEKGTIKDRRTHFEMAIAKQAMERDLPVLGICGGEQSINVALKGSLYQDILSQVKGAMNHEQKHEKTQSMHEVKIASGTLLHKILDQESLEVNSTHHQSVKDPGSGLAVNAVAEDGIIEGIESTRHRFVLGVQWHPEQLVESVPPCRRIFEALVQEAGSKSL